jgi:hypothetical protein
MSFDSFYEKCGGASGNCILNFLIDELNPEILREGEFLKYNKLCLGYFSNPEVHIFELFIRGNIINLVLQITFLKNGELAATQSIGDPSKSDVVVHLKNSAEILTCIQFFKILKGADLCQSK